MSGSRRAIEGEKSADVLCAKCGNPNPRRRSVCQRCGAHLAVVCHHCGHRNERASQRCAACDHKLHRSWLKRTSRRFFGKDHKLTILQAVLLVVAIAVGIGFVIVFSDMHSEQPQP